MAEEKFTIRTRICNWWGKFKPIQRNFILVSIFLVMLPCLVVCIFYICTFSGGLSHDNADWGTFGDFVGGICSLFLTAMNIWIFYLLTRTISEQEAKREDVRQKFEALRFKLQKQEELIKNYSNAVEKTFSSIDLDTGLAVINTNTFDEVMHTYNQLRNFKSLLNTFDSQEYNRLLNNLRHIQNLLHDNGVDDEDFTDWAERMFSHYMALQRIERMLEAEYAQTLNDLTTLKV